MDKQAKYSVAAIVSSTVGIASDGTIISLITLLLSMLLVALAYKAGQDEAR